MRTISSEYDLVVLGPGAGGMTAAAVAAAEGMRVLLIEKSPFVGGTTAVSGGMVWIPANSKMAEAGFADTPELARLYLQSVVRGGVNENLRSVFLASADNALAYLEKKTSVRLKPVKVYPDYYPNLPGATTGGRVLEPVPFNARELGEQFQLLRWPLPEFMLLGGMIDRSSGYPAFQEDGTLTPLRSARRPTVREICPGTAFCQAGHFALSRQCPCGPAPALAAEIERGLSLNTSVSSLIYEGGVTGVEITNVERRQISAKQGVVLATGGFSCNPELRAKYLPSIAGTLSAACPSNTGDGIELATRIGATVQEQNVDNAFWTPVSRFVDRHGSEHIFPHTVTDRAKPGLIAVNRRGRRFANEAVSYHEFVRAMFRAHNESPSIPSYLICDRNFLWKHGLGAVKPFSLSLREPMRLGYLNRAPDVRALALKLGIDPDGLETTVTQFNRGAREGIDREFGRGDDSYQRFLGDAENHPNPCVAPIENPPFYAVLVYPGDLGTAAGLVTDENARVLDDANRPIGHLYACGNDMSSIMNGDYPGPGITLGPALTFGYLAARHMASKR